MAKGFRENLFDSDAQALVNPVNTKGVMGAGLAKQFKSRFPEMFDDYARAAKQGRLRVGALHTYAYENGPVIINLPTKDDWRDPSQLDYITDGLSALSEYTRANGIKSVAVPPLGMGLGGLRREDVYPLMQQTFQHMAQHGVRVDYYDAEYGIETFVPDTELVEPSSHHVMTTGHRPDKFVGGWQYLETPEAIQLHDDFKQLLLDRADTHGHVTAHSGMAQGADTIFAFAAINARKERPGKVALHCDIPHIGQESKWPKAAQEQYAGLRKAADSETIYGETYSTALYHARNQGMVDAADECTAVYNGLDISGGTKSTVVRIKSSGKPLQYLGAYLMANKTVSSEVIHNTYAPSEASRSLMRQVKVIVPESDEKERVASAYKATYRKERTNPSRKAPDAEVGPEME